MPLTLEEYHRIYSLVDSPEDVLIYAGKLRLPRGVLEAVLTLKVIRRVKASYHLVEKQKEELLAEWRGGSSIVEIAGRRRFPPVLIARFLLSAMGFSRRKVKKLALGSESTGDSRLDAELEEAQRADFIFSKKAHERQRLRGALGEEIARSWLQSRGAVFTTEDCMDRTGKTPDFLVKGLRILGMPVTWVESKAVFADEEEHRLYMRKQLSHYLRCFGPGVVVYWYGYVDTILGKRSDLIILDYTHFSHPGVEALLNGSPDGAGDGNKDIHNRVLREGDL
ncbi:MAG: hypothetical protein GXO66_07445 [Euryarchaeota archaeon]|nr:hypothetical protein [Euryarchaeota archaeon]